MPDPTTAVVSLLWNNLNDEERIALHLFAEWPGRDVTEMACRDEMRGRVDALGTEPGNAMHSDVCAAICSVASRWHQQEGRT